MKSTLRKWKVASCDLKERSTFCEFKSTSYEFESWSSKTKSKSCKIKSASLKIKDTINLLQLFIFTNTLYIIRLPRVPL